MNRSKGLALVERMPEELHTEVHNIVQEAVTKTIPKKKKCKKIKWLSEEALQIAEERREVKCKGKMEIYIQWNPEFQRISGREKTTLLNKQGKGIEENNRKSKARDFFMKIGNIKAIFHPKKGTIKDRNG